MTANNGWFALIELERSGKSSTASGPGRWKPGHGGHYNGMQFNLRITRTGGQLYMNMTIEMDNHSKQGDQGNFREPPPAQPTRPASH